ERMLELAQALRERGTSVEVWDSASSALISLMRVEPRGSRQIRLLVRSGLQMLWVAFKERRTPSRQVWALLLEMNYRTDRAYRILKIVHPSVVFCTHERYSPAAEFVVAARKIEG